MFVDFQQANDSINNNLLFHKLYQVSICGEAQKDHPIIIQKEAAMEVPHNGFLQKLIKIKLIILLGKVASLYIFNIFLWQTFKLYLRTKGSPGIIIDGIMLPSYADSPRDLKKKIEEYCKK